MEALECYIATPSSLPLTDLLLSDDDTNEAVSVLAYKKVARKVHPVAASLPEDFRII